MVGFTNINAWTSIVAVLSTMGPVPTGASLTSLDKFNRLYMLPLLIVMPSVVK